jgi:NDP-sugar pyrophosphorylase family protein
MSSNNLTKAMVLAAGFGTRLKPLTDKTPKALVEIDGKPMIENVILKLAGSGIKEIIINTHYLFDKIEKYFMENDFGVNITLIREKEILGTGGAIKNAQSYLKDSEDFLIYNVDVNSDLDIVSMYNFHISNSSFATLAVKKRKTSRPLIVDSNNNLIGRSVNSQKYIFRSYLGKELETAFCGMHIVSSKIFSYFPKESNFDIMPVYMDLIKSGKNLMCFDIKSAFWEDLGKFR